MSIMVLGESCAGPGFFMRLPFFQPGNNLHPQLTAALLPFFTSPQAARPSWHPALSQPGHHLTASRDPHGASASFTSCSPASSQHGPGTDITSTPDPHRTPSPTASQPPSCCSTVDPRGTPKLTGRRCWCDVPPGGGGVAYSRN